MDRDIDQVIAGLLQELPGLKWEQLRVAHQGIDDDGIWFFTHPKGRGEVQVESATGSAPFFVEGDHEAPVTAATVAATIAIVAQQLGLPDRTV